MAAAPAGLRGSRLYRRSLYDRVMGAYTLPVLMFFTCLSGLLPLRLAFRLLSVRSACLKMNLIDKITGLVVLFNCVELWVRGGNVAKKGGRPLQCMRNLRIFNVIRRYYDFKVVYDVPKELLDTGRASVLALHPHGIFVTSSICSLVSNTRLLPESMPYRVATVWNNFILPFWRDLFLAVGFVDTSPESWKQCLSNGISVAAAIGGAEEALDSRPGTLDLTLARRTGFIRVALQHGAPIIPILSFGETDIFQPLVSNRKGSRIRDMQEWMKEKMGFSLPIVNLLAPRPVQISIVVGRPLILPYISAPSPADIALWHKRYCDALFDIYERYREQCYAVPHSPLRIVDKPMSRL